MTGRVEPKQTIHRMHYIRGLPCAVGESQLCVEWDGFDGEQPAGCAAGDAAQGGGAGGRVRGSGLSVQGAAATHMVTVQRLGGIME